MSGPVKVKTRAPRKVRGSDAAWRRVLRYIMAAIVAVLIFRGETTFLKEILYEVLKSLA